MSGQRAETIALHGGQTADPTTKARAVPIYQTTSYEFDDTQHAADLFALKVPGNIYTRIMNPTWDVFEQRVTALEGGLAACSTASGQAAVTYSVLNLARAGDNIISVSTLYGGTYNLFAHTLPQYGIEVRFADPDDPEAVARLTDDKTRLVFAETIGNPKLNVVDLRAWADAAHAQGLPLIVDNTVATPIHCRVFDHGVDVAVHSATKYIGGHGTSIGGIVVDSGRFDWTANAERFPGPDPAGSLVPRRRLGRRARAGGLHRARAHGAAAQHRGGALAVQRVPLPAGPRDAAAAHGAPLGQRAGGRPSPRGPLGGEVGQLPRPRELALPRARQAAALRRLRRPGHVRHHGRARGRRSSSSRASSSSATSPTSATPSRSRSTTRRRRTRSSTRRSSRPPGVTQDTVRLSVGIEHIEDILADLEQALARARVPVTA